MTLTRVLSRLQWGRGFVAAEAARVANVRVTESGFNGAAAL